MLNDLQAGDTVVVKSIDRLSRSTKDLLEIVEQIRTDITREFKVSRTAVYKITLLTVLELLTFISRG